MRNSVNNCNKLKKKLYIKITNNCYQKHKEKLSKKAHERYLNLSEEEKEKKDWYGCKRLKNLLEDKFRNKC